MIDSIKRKVRVVFTFWDIAFLKLYGAIPAFFIGAYYPNYFKGYGAPFIAVFFALFVRYLYIIVLYDEPQISNAQDSICLSNNRTNSYSSLKN